MSRVLGSPRAPFLHGRGRDWGLWGVLTVVAAASLGVLIRWDNWFLNYDGGSYLALAKSLSGGNGYRFPDGSFASFRGPAYPGLLAVSWTVLPMTIKSAIWVSRMVLVANTVLVAGLARRITGRLWLALLAGLLIAVQPLPLVSGGMFLVPDGLAAFFVLGAVWIWCGSQRGLSRRNELWQLAAGFAFGIAFVAKETAALALLVPLAIEARRGGFAGLVRAAPRLTLGWLAPVVSWALVALVRVGRLPDSMGGLRGTSAWLVLGVGGVGAVVWHAVERTREQKPIRQGRIHPVVAFTVILTGSVVVLANVGAPLVRPVSELGTALQQDWDRWLYLGTPRQLLLIGFAPALFWALSARRSASVMAALGFVAVGIAQLIHASLAQLGPRNGVLFAYGAVLLVVAWIDSAWNVRRARSLVRFLAVGVFLLLLVISANATERTNQRIDGAALTWDTATVRAAAARLQATSLPVIGTPVFLSYMWFLQADHPRFDLIPFLVSDPVAGRGLTPVFERLTSWAGHRPAPERSSWNLVGLTVARSGIAAVDYESIWSDSVPRVPSLVAITGNLATLAAAFDGGILLPFMEAQPNAHKVYQSATQNLPQWVVIYEIDGPLQADVSPPLVHMAVDAPIPDIAENQVIMDNDDYRDMILSVLSVPVEFGQ